MIAKELILLSKRKYQELLDKNKEAQETLPSTETNDNKGGISSNQTNIVETQMQTGNGMFVEKTSNDDDCYYLPGILDRPIREKRKTKPKWIQYLYLFFFINIMYTKIKSYLSNENNCFCFFNTHKVRS